MSQFIAEAVNRKLLSQDCSRLLGGELPEYLQFTKIVEDSNINYLDENPDAEVDSEHRVLAEKHGAIRVATAYEMNMMARIFRVFGMHPVEFYDMTALDNPLPMISTAFRCIDETIEKSAFRVFTSMLHPNEEYIPVEARDVVKKMRDERSSDANPKFSKKLRDLLNEYETKGGLTEDQAKELRDEVMVILTIDKNRVIDFDLYQVLRKSNDALSDAICIGINLNHLTPRAYDIQDATQRMVDAGIPMKDGGIEGPPIREDGVIIQLNQTSRKAPGEELVVSKDPNTYADADFTELKKGLPLVSLGEGEKVGDYMGRIDEALQANPVIRIEHKARFGEIESRGVALTVDGELLYKQMLREKRYKKDFPKTHQELHDQALAYYTYALTEKGKSGDASSGKTLDDYLKEGLVKLMPQTYDDFLAASAAGIFKSNMTTGTAGVSADVKTDVAKNKQLLEECIGRPIVNRHDLHKLKRAMSALKVFDDLKVTMPSALKTEYEKTISESKAALEQASATA